MSTPPISSNAFLSSLMSSSSSTSGSSASTAASGAMGAASTFYNLLVTQLTNQDPLNPMDASGMSAELAQFSTASGVQGVEQSLAAMAAQINQSQGLQAANLVGKNVTYNSNTLSLGASGAAAGFTLSGAASNVNVTIANAAGQVVDTLQLGSLPAGVQAFNWGGTDGSGNAMAQGNYSFNVQATDTSGNAVSATPFGVGTVAAVMLGGSSGPSLQLQGQSASVPLSSLQGVI